MKPNVKRPECGVFLTFLLIVAIVGLSLFLFGIAQQLAGGAA